MARKLLSVLGAILIVFGVSLPALGAAMTLSGDLASGPQTISVNQNANQNAQGNANSKANENENSGGNSGGNGNVGGNSGGSGGETSGSAGTWLISSEVQGTGPTITYTAYASPAGSTPQEVSHISIVVPTCLNSTQGEKDGSLTDLYDGAVIKSDATSFSITWDNWPTDTNGVRLAAVSGTGYIKTGSKSGDDGKWITTSVLVPPCPPAPKGSVTVSVKDNSTGTPQPMANLTVNLSNGGGTGTTGSDGKVLFSNLAFGTYTATVSATKNAETKSGTGTATISQADPDGEIEILLAWTPTPPTTGSVTVFVKDNSPSLGGAQVAIAGATVSLSNGSSGTTDSEGKFVVSDLAFGAYTATVSATKNAETKSGTGTATISQADPDGEIEILLAWTPTPPTTGSVTVFVKDNSPSLGGAQVAIAGATVSLSNGSSGTTDSEGKFVVSDLAFGTYTADASAAKNAETKTGTGTATIGEGTPNGVITILLAWTPPPTPKGSVTVFVKDNSPSLGGAQVAIAGAAVSLSNGSSGTTDSEGKFVVSDLAFGTYTADASAAKNAETKSGTGTATIGEGTPAGVITILLAWSPPPPPSSTGSVTVRVQDNSPRHNGNPVPMSNLTVRLSNGMTGTTNASGRVTFIGLEFGAYSAETTAANPATGSDPQNGSGTTTIGQANPNGVIDILLAWSPPPPPTPMGSVTVRVYDNSDRTGPVAIAGAAVTLSNGSTGTTNAAGEVVFRPLGFDSYEAEATATKGTQTLTGSGSIAINQANPDGVINILLAWPEPLVPPTPTPTPQLLGKITVRVFDGSDRNKGRLEPITGAKITLAGRSGTSDASGQFTFDKLPFAQYTADVEAVDPTNRDNGEVKKGSGLADISPAFPHEVINIVLKWSSPIAPPTPIIIAAVTNGSAQGRICSPRAPGAELVATDEGGSTVKTFVASTGQLGVWMNYVLENLAPGKWTITLNNPGDAPATHQVTVNSGQPAAVPDFSLACTGQNSTQLPTGAFYLAGAFLTGAGLLLRRLGQATA